MVITSSVPAAATAATKWSSLPLNNIITAGAASTSTSLHTISVPSLSSISSISAAPVHSSCLSSSAVSTLSPPPSSPSLPHLTTSCKSGSVLGLKSCHLTLPPSSSGGSGSRSSIAHLDLHTQYSSRGFIEAIVSDSPINTKPRSAGSFRLEYESFSWSTSKDKELNAIQKEKMPLSTSINGPIAHVQAGRFSFEEKSAIPALVPPWPTYATFADARPMVPAGGICSNIEGEAITEMPWCTSADTRPVVRNAGADKSNTEGASSLSGIHWSTPLEAPVVPITEQRPITSRACSTFVSLHAPVAPTRLVAVASRFNAELEGDITAADVDLLPMPGLVSLASPLYDSYLSVSPTDSRMTRISSSDYLSTANSSKTSSKAAAPDYLGLPPEILDDVDAKHSSEPNSDVYHLGCPMMRAASIGMPNQASDQLDDIEIAASNSNSSYPVVEDDNFAESQSLAGLWSTHDEVNCNADSILHGSEDLASILTGLPNKQGATSCNICNHDEEQGIGSEFIMDDLDYLMMPGKAELSMQGVRNAVQHHIPNGSHLVGVPNACKDHLNPGKPEVEFNTKGEHNAASFTSAYSNVECKHGGVHCESSQESIILARMPFSPSAWPGEVSSHVLLNGNQRISTSSIPTHMERTHISIGPPNMMVGKKRQFSAYEHLPRSLSPALAPCMFNPNSIPQSVACQSISMQQEKLENQHQEMSYSSATQAFSAMLYKAQGGGSGHNRFNWATSYMNDSGDSIRIPPSKSRRRHGTAMDPQSIAARTRREKFSDRIRILQSLVPNGERLDTVSMLGQTLEYVRFLQHQVWQLYHGMDPASNLKCEKWKDFLEAAEPAAGST